MLKLIQSKASHCAGTKFPIADTVHRMLLSGIAYFLGLIISDIILCYRPSDHELFAFEHHEIIFQISGQPA